MSAVSIKQLVAVERDTERKCRRAATAFTDAGRSAEAAWATRLADYYAWRRQRWAAIYYHQAQLPPPTFAEWKAGGVIQARFA